MLGGTIRVAVRRGVRSSPALRSGAIAALTALALCSPAIGPATAVAQPDRVFTVNSLGDAEDPNALQLGDDGVCDTGAVTPTGDPECTLRAAIQNQNAVRNLDHNEIRFGIDPSELGFAPRIDVGETGLGELPFVLGSVTIDGTTQRDAGGLPVRIAVHGAEAGDGATGLQVLGAQTTVGGLRISGFSGDGILVSGTGPPGEGGHRIIDNHVVGNGDDGIHLESHDTTIDGNLATGNGSAGVHVAGDGVERNVVQGNATIANAGDGILLEAPDSAILTNHVAGNGRHGVHLLGGGAAGNLLQANRVGTTADGAGPQGNGGDGIRADGAGSNQIGSAGGNVVSGNGGHGIHVRGAAAAGTQVQENLVGTNAAGDTAVPNAGDGIHVEGTPGLTIGGAGAGNVVSGNAGHGIVIDGAAAAGDTVAGNTIGLSRDGSAPLPNGKDAVVVDGAPNATVGGTEAAEANRMHGTQNGVRIEGSLAKGIAVKGNFVGKSGTAAKFTVGILHRGGNQLTVDGNFITQVAGVGIDVRAETSGNYTIGRNRIFGQMEIGTKLTFGPDRTVDIAYKNNFQLANGVGLQAEESVGGTINWDVAGNDVSAGGTGAKITLKAKGTKKFEQDKWDTNVEAGFVLDAKVSRDVEVGMSINLVGEQYEGNQQGADGLRVTITTEAEVRLTLLGVRAARNGGRGVSVEAFALGGGKVVLNGRQLDVSFNGQVGLRVRNGSGATPFFTVGLEHSLFDGNTKGAVALFGVEFKFSVVDNRLTDNGEVGILVGEGSEGRVADNTVTGSPVGVRVQDDAQAALAGNELGGNGVGVEVVDAADAALAGNLIRGSARLGIDLGGDGVTPNDPGDADGGPSGLQNFPVVEAVSASEVRGTLDSTPGTPFRVQLFASEDCHPSGFGEGERVLGETDVTTGADGRVRFAVPAAVASGQVVTATASRLVDDGGPPGTPAVPRATSEFSPCRAAGDAGSISGVVFEDLDGDGARDPGERGTAGWTVFLDDDGDGLRDPAEPAQVSDADGSWSFTGLAAGTYRVREVLQSGFRLTAPPGGVHEVVLGPGEHAGGRDFGNAPADTTAPVTRASLVPAPNRAGWNRTAVEVTLRATDPGGSGVEEVVFSATGAEPRPRTTVPGSVAGLRLTTPGITRLSFFARDRAGNTELTRRRNIRIDTAAPVLSVADLVVPATGPEGALVRAYPVSASDDLTPVPAIACDPSAPRTFPVHPPGDSTTVTCTATDLAGNATTESFRVHVQGAAEQLDALRELVIRSGADAGTERKLLADLAKARRSLDRDRRAAACAHLRAFLAHVRSADGRGLPSGRAAELTAGAERIRSVAGC